MIHSFSRVILLAAMSLGWMSPAFSQVVPAASLSVTDHSASVMVSGVASPLGTWSLLPAKPARQPQVSQVVAGQAHSLVLKLDGSVQGWGYNTSGAATIPSDLGPVTALAVGSLFSVALTQTGSLRGWGANYQGRLPVPSATHLVSVSAGESHGLALRADGTVISWGSNESGQRNIPAGLGNVIAVAAGGKHSMALRADGTVIAWGDNRIGQCNVPADVTQAVAIAAGQWHSAALLADGSVRYWASYMDNWARGNRPEASSLRDAIAISAGGYSVMALRRGGSVVAWGGDEARLLPADLGPAVSVSAGYTKGMALHADGSVTNWEDSAYYTLWPRMPTELAPPQEGPDLIYTRLGYLENHGTAVLTGVRAEIEGPDADQFSVLLTQVTNIAVGGKSAFAIRCHPTRGGSLSAVLKIHSNAPDSPFLVPLRSVVNGELTATKAGGMSGDFTYGPLRAERQTGLMLQQIRFTNKLGGGLHGLRLYLSKVATGVSVYSSSVSRRPGTVEVFYPRTIAAEETVSFDLVYHDPKRRTQDAILPKITAEAILDPVPASPPVSGKVVMPGPRVTLTAQGPQLDWTSKVKARYVVEYSDDGWTWQSAVHLLQAGSNRMTWVDRGPPETRTKPALNPGGAGTSRRYMIKIR